MNYSAPVDLKLTLDELQPHLHSLPDLPDATPYVTSYYKRTWGFCLSERVRRSLERGTYHAYIDSEFVGANRGGCLEYGHCSLPGRYARTVVLTSYLCHPSLANNELSGPLVLLGLYDRIRRWPDRRFTYRFVLNPETIGSLCYLHRYGELLRSTVEAGLVLTCLGGPEPRLSYKTTRRESALLDRLVAALNFQENLGFRIRPFTPAHGSGERQYCSPGFDLPFGQLSRTVYGEYPGYHNSVELGARVRKCIIRMGASVRTVRARIELAPAELRFAKRKQVAEAGGDLEPLEQVLDHIDRAY